MYLLSYRLPVDDELTPVGVYSTDRLAKDAFWVLRRDLQKVDEVEACEAVIEQFLLDKPPAGRYAPRTQIRFLPKSPESWPHYERWSEWSTV